MIGISGRILLKYGNMYSYMTASSRSFRKLHMHWLGPFIVMEIKYSGVVRLAQLEGVLIHGWVNGTWLKPFHKAIFFFLYI